jgi:hypothetical protein
MVKRKTLRRVKVKYGVDPELERIANIYLEGDKPAKPKKDKSNVSGKTPRISGASHISNIVGRDASKMIGHAAGRSLARGKRLASSGEGVKAKRAISVGDGLIGAGMVAKAGADASPWDLAVQSKNPKSFKDSAMITGATRVGRKTRQTDAAIRATRKTLRTGKVVGGKRGSILGIAAMFASHLAGNNKKDRG